MTLVHRRLKFGVLSGLLASAVIGLFGCGLDYRLSIYNVDRNPVRVFVNKNEVGRLMCTDGPLILTPTFSHGLPWEVEVIDESTSDRIGGSKILDGGNAVQFLLIKDFGVVLVPPNDPAPNLLGSIRPDCPGLPPNALPRPVPTT